MQGRHDGEVTDDGACACAGGWRRGADRFRRCCIGLAIGLRVWFCSIRRGFEVYRQVGITPTADALMQTARGALGRLTPSRRVA